MRTQCWTILHRPHTPALLKNESYLVTARTWLMLDDYPDPDALEDEIGWPPDSPTFLAAWRSRFPATPTIRVQDFVIPRLEIDLIVLEIQSMVLPIVTQEDPPNDTTSYEVTLGYYLSGVQYR